MPYRRPCLVCGTLTVRTRCNACTVNPYGRQYRKERAAALKRDGYRCRGIVAGKRCKTVEGLQAHHVRKVLSFGTHGEDNLITLCPPCHRRYEKTLRIA